MSNLYKAGFVSFAQNETLVIDANKHKIIREIHEQTAPETDASADDEALTEGNMGEEFHNMQVENIDMQEVRQQADAVFEEARIAAEHILEEARAEAMILKEEAISQGKEEGYARGMEEAMTVAAAREQELKAHYERVGEQLALDYEQQIRDLEPQFIHLLCRLIHKVTGVFVEGHEEVMVHILDQALQGIETTGEISIKVSQENYAQVYSRFDQLVQQVNSNVHIELVSDPKLNAYQGYIETENGIINCSLDEQLDNLVVKLKLLAQIQ